MNRLAPLLLLFLFLAPEVRGDVLPPGKRGVGYRLTVVNIKDYPDHVFIAYPTTNSGFGYVLEEGKEITNLFMRKSFKGPATALYAMTREAFKAFQPKPAVHPHGNKDEPVMVVPAPPSPPRALKAAVTIEPPALVPRSSPVVTVERVFRIKKLDKKIFELELLKEVEIHRDGTKKEHLPKGESS